MTLENLLKIGQLKRHEADAREISDLLAAARRNLGDARVEAISPETRFDAAYKAIMQAALVAMMANGYRPDTNRPGHHATVIQALPKTIGLNVTLECAPRHISRPRFLKIRCYPTTAPAHRDDRAARSSNCARSR